MKILIIGQIPPPYHGQSIMMELLTHISLEGVTKIVIPMRFSDQIKDVGKFDLKKIFRLLSLTIQILLQGRGNYCVYPPTGFSKSGLYRDIAILIMLRLMGNKIIYVFHSGGLLQNIQQSFNFNRHILAIIKKIYSKPHHAIVLTNYLVDEIRWMNPRTIDIVPNGLPDKNKYRKNSKNIDPMILYLSNMDTRKGPFVLLDALHILRERKVKFKSVFVGDFHDAETRKKFYAVLESLNLREHSTYLGSLTGEAKYEILAKADIFCFPTFHDENLPLVLIEAMMFSLPIVSTHWRSIPEIITNGFTGILVPPKDPSALAGALHNLLENRQDRTRMGVRARERYEAKYSVEQYLTSMRRSLESAIHIQ